MMALGQDEPFCVIIATQPDTHTHAQTNQWKLHQSKRAAAHAIGKNPSAYEWNTTKNENNDVRNQSKHMGRNENEQKKRRKKNLCVFEK
jgi:uncharacterized protein involved in tolerance to divalent cations